MSSHPAILVAYPSAFCLPSQIDVVEIKTPQLLLASYLSQFFPVEYADFEVTVGRPSSPSLVRRYERRVRDYLMNHQFDILALSCWTSVSYRATMTTARIFRELYPDKLIVVGGYHPSARPQDFLTPDNLIDYVVCGEGEMALREIADQFSGAQRPGATQIVKAPSFTQEHFVPCNWELVDSFARINFPNGVTNIFLYLSRGCPFGCSFCMEPLKDRKWRAHSPEQSVREIQTAASRFSPGAIAVSDACFGMRSAWRKEFLRRLSDARPTPWLIFETRPEYLDENDVELLSGLKVEVQFGIESCSPHILRLMNKTRQPEKFLERFRQVSRLLSEHQVLHRANLIFNHPGETHQTLQETFGFMDSMLTDENSYLIWACHGYMHFPGCEVDRNRSYYEREFGSRFSRPEWWREEFVQLLESEDTQPSADLTLGNTKLWEQMLKEREDKFRASLAPRALSFAARKYFPEWQSESRYHHI